MRFLSVLALGLAAGASAHSITNEVIANSAQSTSANPRTGSVSDVLHLAVDVTPRWTLSLGAMGTYEGQTPDTGRDFGTSAATVGLFSAGVEFLASDHWVFGATFTGSPESALFAGTFFT